MPRQTHEMPEATAKLRPLRASGEGLVKGADRIMRTPAEHQAPGISSKAARIGT